MSTNPALLHKANLLRKWSLVSTTAAASGHPTSCLSAADLIAVLFEDYYSYDTQDPTNLLNDRLIFSKGHAAPLLYAAYAVRDALGFEELKTLRQFGSRLEGHPTPRFPFTEAATGSLGQGLSVGVGMALGLKKVFAKLSHLKATVPHVFVLLGDGELAEGQVWEAANMASYQQVSNLIAIADINRLGQSDPTMYEYQLEIYKARFEAFGFHTFVIDGHTFAEITQAFESATHNETNKPIMILAKTVKGKGVQLFENKEGWHGKALSEQQLQQALIELGSPDDSLSFPNRKPSTKVKIESVLEDGKEEKFIPIISPDEKEIATREVYGRMLLQAAKSNPKILALDGDTKNSTFSQLVFDEHPEQGVEGFIAEQNLTSMAVGLSRLGFKPYISTFAAFLTRAADQIRMAAISESTISFTGSHAGISIGEDGPSQMGLEDIALFGALPGSVILQPADGITVQKLFPSIVSHTGISYLRTLRPKTALLYKKDEEFRIGGSKVLKKSEQDVLTIIASGITVHEALRAADSLENEGVRVRVVDCYSLKPIDTKTLHSCLEETTYPILLTVEDHYAHGGLGDFVLSAVSESEAKVVKLAVSHISESGKMEELLKDAGIDSKAIISTVKHLLSHI
jgi:transketolase